LETDIPDVATAIEVLALAVEALIENAQVPVGCSIRCWNSGGSHLPSLGTWLIMMGQTVTQSAYPALWDANPSWRSGSNIIIPDTRDRVPVGAGSSYAVGATGGSTTSTLGTAHIPRFTGVALSLTDPTHFHAAQPGFDVIVQTTSAENLESAGSGTQVSSNVGNPNTDSKATGITGTVTFGNSSPTPVSILQPYIASYEIVRAA
jgi:microcystin-dependent protein